MQEQERASALRNADIVHLSGGEVIPFAARLRASGCDLLLKHFLARGGVVLGVSASAMVLGKTFKSASLYKERGHFWGLNIFEFEIIPHAAETFQKPNLSTNFASRSKIEIYALNDGDIIVLNGKKIRTYGSVQHFNGK